MNESELRGIEQRGRAGLAYFKGGTFDEAVNEHSVMGFSEEGRAFFAVCRWEVERLRAEAFQLRSGLLLLRELADDEAAARCRGTISKGLIDELLGGVPAPEGKP